MIRKIIILIKIFLVIMLSDEDLQIDIYPITESDTERFDIYDGKTKL